jgi:NmrA-like family
VVVVDFGDADALQASMKGVKVLVSTVGGANLKEAEISLMNAAHAAGASLNVPSLYGFDFRRWTTTFPYVKDKLAVLQHAESLGLPTLQVQVGLFSDTSLLFFADVPNRKATVVNGGKSLCSFIRHSDVGYVLAEALANPKYNQGGFLSMHAETVPFMDYLNLIEEVGGFKFVIEDLTGEQAHQREQELLSKGDMGSFFAAWGVHLLAEPVHSHVTGFDVSAEADNHGHKIEPLRSTIERALK